MRKVTTILLTIMLAAAVSTVADAKKKKHAMKAAAPAAVSKINGYAWPGTPYPVVLATKSATCYGCNP